MLEEKNNKLIENMNVLNYSVTGTGVYVEMLEKCLPFQLTTCQRTAMEEVKRDMKSRGKMSRLIQGDVGTGM